MRKHLLLFAALVISAFAFADGGNLSTWDIPHATLAGVNKGSYGDLKDAEKVITLDGVIYLAQDIMRNNKNTSLDIAADQILMFKKNAGHFINKSSMTLISLTIIVNDETLFEVSSGTDAENLTAEALTAANESVELLDANGTEATKTLRMATVDLTGKNFVKLAALNSGTPFLYTAVLRYEGSGGEATHVTSVTLNEHAKTLAAFETLQLEVTVAPDDADDKAVTWASSDEKIATVDENGLVTAWAAGAADIVVKSVDAEKTDTCKLTVTAATKSDFGRIKLADLKDNDTVIITMTVDSIGVPMVLNAVGASSSGPKGIAGGIIEGTITPAIDNVIFVAHINEDGIRFVPKGYEEIDSVFLYVSGAPSNNDGVRVKKIGKDDNVGDRWIIDDETGYLKATYVYVSNKGKENESSETITRYLGVNDGTFKAYKLDAKGRISNMIKDETLKLFVKGAEPPVEYYFKMTWAGSNSTEPLWAPALDGAEDEMPEAWTAANYWKSEDILVNTKPSDEGAIKFVHEGGTAETQIIYMNVAENCVDCSAEPAAGTLVEVIYCTPEFTINPNLAGHLIVMYLINEGIENIQIDATKTEKVLIDGQLYIIRDGAIYSVQGIRVK